MISGVLLAAGSAKRFGGAKLTQDLNGQPVIRWSAEALEPVVDDLVVVVPAGGADVRRALKGVQARFVENADAGRGLSSSLALAIESLGDEADAALVALADQPTLSSAAHELVITRFRKGGVAIVAANYHGQLGHPVLFDRGVFPELVALQGDRGARHVVERDPARVAMVEMGADYPLDVDTPEDLARLRNERHL